MAQTPEETLEEAKKYIGREAEPVHGRYPVEYEPIRRYCFMNDDDNPLFLDAEYAKTTKYGDVISPPLLIGNFTSPGLWPPVKEGAPLMMQIPTPGNSNINLTTDFEYFRPVKIGDRLSSKAKIADVYIKAIRLDPKAFWIETETTTTNQNDEVVMVSKNIAVRHRTPEEVTAAGDA